MTNTHKHETFTHKEAQNNFHCLGAKQTTTSTTMTHQTRLSDSCSTHQTQINFHGVPKCSFQGFFAREGGATATSLRGHFAGTHQKTNLCRCGHCWTPLCCVDKPLVLKVLKLLFCDLSNLNILNLSHQAFTPVRTSLSSTTQPPPSFPPSQQVFDCFPFMQKLAASSMHCHRTTRTHTHLIRLNIHDSIVGKPLCFFCAAILQRWNLLTFFSLAVMPSSTQPHHP